MLAPNKILGTPKLVDSSGLNGAVTGKGSSTVVCLNVKY